ncbi:MAG: hypothetical protein JWO36_1383, partial [Myxococcales bacterium]|nr:hypothetical protein [Myxococcales bacterium]
MLGESFGAGMFVIGVGGEIGRA